MIAILGANGFIGTRLTEFFHLTRFAQVRPVVRRYSSLAGLSRFNLDFRIADGSDQNSLKQAFEGCEAIVVCISGDPTTILNTITPVYNAAQHSGVERIVYLSSASVHGQMPAKGTDEESRLEMRQPLPYNNAKVRAEKMLRKLRKKGRVEVVILRPGIVYGPRSSWITDFADDLITGKAWLLNKGSGICNAVYIDNLVNAVSLALKEEDIDGESFLIRDREEITWADLYRPVAEYLGYSLKDLPEADKPFKSEKFNFIEVINNNKQIKALISPVPKKIRLGVYSGLSNMLYNNKPVSEWSLPEKQLPDITLEKIMLYKCDYALPWKKAYKFLNYEPLVSFSEASRRTIGWLEFAGYSSSKKLSAKVRSISGF